MHEFANLCVKEEPLTDTMFDYITALWGSLLQTLSPYCGSLLFTHLFFKISVNVTVHHLGNVFTRFATVK